ncbi:predicted protein [Plenodomus lingam JN3]|uniref:Predicted protein n=1 Tax=Leptosphaeria maculans (strain JN3 / isolate v23.1.3 / race Av1-4-5-6-7-8) TaxID=985895 RepID=E4ZUI9_LEPMJ|nr:predicted protein [Plenodomus lingam JN3]CBX95068.1 predicted protein [Plenodomus lingam JN3]
MSTGVSSSSTNRAVCSVGFESSSGRSNRSRVLISGDWASRKDRDVMIVHATVDVGASTTFVRSN